VGGTVLLCSIPETAAASVTVIRSGLSLTIHDPTAGSLQSWLTDGATPCVIGGPQHASLMMAVESQGVLLALTIEEKYKKNQYK
jgi:hypothetical protein